jgi:hypothetical protein
MPAKFYRVFIRPSLEIVFPTDPAEFTQYINDTYISTGKCAEHRTVSYSEDNLTKTYTSVWNDAAAFDLALTDPKYIENRDFLIQYCEGNQITTYTWTE